MDCGKFSKILDKIFKLPLAESWDNVGLILQPSYPFTIKHILLTNDVTEPVIDEAIKCGTNFIISYHPPIFRALKKITQNSWKERVIVKCMENRIAIYSPHTAIDAVSGGVNDWLVSPLEAIKISPLEKHKHIENSSVLSFKMGEDVQAYCMKNKLPPMQVDIPSDAGRLIEVNFCPEADAVGDWIVNKTEPCIFTDDEGSGRIVLLKKGKTIKDVVETYKKLFNIHFLKVAIGYGKTIDSPVSCLAVCAGSGGSLFNTQPMALLADVLVTGEASHHDQLEAVSRGATIITAGHTVTERGYLSQRLKPWLEEVIASSCVGEDVKVCVDVSTMDAEPGVII